MVADLKPAVLAPGLHAAYDVPGDALEEQVLGDLGVETDRDRALVEDLDVCHLAALDYDVVGADGDLALAVCDALRLTVQDRRDLVAGERLDDGCDLLHRFAEPGAEDLEVGLGTVADEPGLVRLDVDLLDVQLLLDDVGIGLDDSPLVGVAVHDEVARERLTDLELAGCAKAPAHRDALHGQSHLPLEHQVASILVGDRPVVEMHGLGHALRPEVKIHLFGHEGDERTGELDECHEHLVQGVVCHLLVAVVLALPESPAAASDVPVVQVVDEAQEKLADGLHVIGLEGRRDVVDELVRLADDPPVQRIDQITERRLPRLIAVDVGVCDEEAVCIPQRQHEELDDVLDVVVAELQILGLHHLGVQQREAERIRAVLCNDLHRVGVVVQALGHLLAVLGQDDSGDHAVEERGLVEQSCGDDRKRIEPTAGLVQTLVDEVGGEMGLEALLVLEGIVHLGVGHRAGLEPAVQDVRDPPHGALSIRTGPCDLVDEVLVQVLDLVAALRLELGDRADDLDVVGAVALPHGDRVAPEPVAGDGPLACTLKPLAEAAVLDVCRNPVDLLVARQEHVLDPGHVDEPAAHSTVDQRCTGPPAEGIRVQVVLLLDELAVVLEPLDDRLVGILDEEALPVRNLVREAALLVDRAHRRDAGAPEDLVVVLAEAGSRMDDAAAVLGRDVVAAHDDERTLPLEVCEVREERLICHALHPAALQVLDDTAALSVLVVLVQQLLCQIVELAALLVLDLDVVDVGSDGKGQVAGKRPRSRGPGQEICVLLSVDLEADGDRGIGDIAVAAQVDLHVRKRTCKGRRIREDVEAFVDQPLVIQCLEDPPDGLHVVLVHRAVALAEVDPAAHPVDALLPFGGVAQDDRATLLVELVDTVVDYGLVAGDAQLLLDDALDGKSVTVPAETALDAPAPHRLVTGDGILYGSGHEVSEMGKSRGERRSVIEHVFIVFRAHLDGLLEDVVLLPEPEHALFHLGKVCLAANRTKHIL